VHALQHWTSELPKRTATIHRIWPPASSAFSFFAYGGKDPMAPVPLAESTQRDWKLPLAAQPIYARYAAGAYM